MCLFCPGQGTKRAQPRTQGSALILSAAFADINIRKAGLYITSSASSSVRGKGRQHVTQGRNILMTMFQGGGNIPQLLPIVARLVTLGHRVRVLVGPGVRRS